jgi:enoyl-CoA hydratase/carnithine racemase
MMVIWYRLLFDLVEKTNGAYLALAGMCASAHRVLHLGWVDHGVVHQYIR